MFTEEVKMSLNNFELALKIYQVPSFLSLNWCSFFGWKYQHLGLHIQFFLFQLISELAVNFWVIQW